MKLFSKTIASFLLASAVFVVFSKISYATASQNFPTCLAPQGRVVADFADGTHGIVGLGSKDGHDTVYSLEGGNVLQCLCATDGRGIETDWMIVGNLTPDQIKIYENEGWIYVPDGSAWGLSEGPYLAKNTSYSCNTSTTNSGGQGQEPNNPTDGRTDGKSDGVSIVQASTGTSLASTGNIFFVLSILTSGLIFSLLGFYLRKNSR